MCRTYGALFFLVVGSQPWPFAFAQGKRAGLDCAAPPALGCGEGGSGGELVLLAGRCQQSRVNSSLPGRGCNSCICILPEPHLS